MVRAAALALTIALAPAAAHGAGGVRLEGPARASARAGAARLDLALANGGSGAAWVDAAPERLAVRVRDALGAEVPCAEPRGPARKRLLPSGERLGVVVDLGARCGLAAPGTYRVEVRYGERERVRTVLTLTAWTNPGVRPPPRPAARERP